MHRLTLAAPLLLIACAGPQSRSVAVVPPPVVPTVALARPLPPTGFGTHFATPPRDAAGSYATPGAGIGAGERLWHLRAGLNVAALACRESDMAPAYNAMLARLAKPLAAANAAVERRYRTGFAAAGWRDAHDDGMTRLYNWFAQPFAKGALCRAAADALTEAQTLDPAAAHDFATRHLPRLEAAVTDGYRRWDSWQVADAAWRSRYETPLAMLSLGRTADARH